MVNNKLIRSRACPNEGLAIVSILITNWAAKTRGCVSWDSYLAMVFKLAASAAQRWRWLNGAEPLVDIITGVQFKDGVKVEGQRVAA